MSQKTFILITGAAGFIGYHLCKFLLSKGFSIIGVDNLNSYYDVKLKKDRLNQLGISKAKLDNYNKLVCSDTYKLKMKFIKLDICDYENLTKIFKTNKISSVCNLAAQAGVRESIKNPHIYFVTKEKQAFLFGISDSSDQNSCSVVGMNCIII